MTPVSTSAPTPSTGARRLVVATVSLALAAAAGLHLAVLPDHLEEGLVIGGFFLVCAVLQLAAAVWVSAGAGARSRQLIILGNLVVIAIWAVSRTVGLPIGPDAGAPEPVSTLDALSFVAELVAVGGLALLAGKRRAPSRVWKLGPVAALTVTSFLVAGTAMAFTPSEHHHDEPGARVHVHAEHTEHTEPAVPAAEHHPAH